MVLITKDIKTHRKFDGKRFTLEGASKTKTRIHERQDQLSRAGYSTRVIKNKKHGYLLYST